MLDYAIYKVVLDGIAKGTSCFLNFCTWCILTSQFIELKVFCTCFTHFTLHRKTHITHVRMPCLESPV